MIFIYKIESKRIGVATKFVKVKPALQFGRTNDINKASRWESKKKAKSWEGIVKAKFPDARLVECGLTIK